MTQTPEARSRIMRAVKGKDTQPELKVRRLLHAAGFRYRLHVAELPGKPDLVFPSKRKAIFVHGCWWHGHKCTRGARRAKNNADYWSEKIARNIARDAMQVAELRSAGWKCHTVWECEMHHPRLLSKLKRFLNTNSGGNAS